MKYFNISLFSALKMALFIIILSHVTSSVLTARPPGIACDENFDCPNGDVCDTDVQMCVNACKFRNSKGSPCAKNAYCAVSSWSHKSNCWCDDGYAGDAYEKGCEEVEWLQ